MTLMLVDAIDEPIHSLVRLSYSTTRQIPSADRVGREWQIGAILQLYQEECIREDIRRRPSY
jgi:hypothetical protein